MIYISDVYMHIYALASIHVTLYEDFSIKWQDNARHYFSISIYDKSVLSFCSADA